MRNKNILSFWIEKFYLISELIKKAGYKYFLIILSCRIIYTFVDFLSIGFAVNYFFSSTTEISLLKNISLYKALILLSFLVVIKAITKGIADVIREKVRLEFSDNLRKEFLAKILYSSNNKFFNIQKKDLSGLLIGNISQSVLSLEQFTQLLSSNFSLIIYISGLLSINKEILFPILLSITATLVALLFKRYKGWELGNTHLKLNNSLLSIIGDGLNNLKTIKSYSVQEWVLNKFNKETFNYRKIHQETIIRKAYFDGLKDLFLVLIVGFWLIKFSNFNEKSIIISTLIFSYRVSQYFGSIISSVRLCLYSLPGFKNLKEISKKLNEDLYIAQPSFNIYKEKLFVKSFKWETKEKLKLSQLSLKNEKLLVITGKTGIGKTTLLDSIIGLNNPLKSKWEIETNSSLRRIRGNGFNKEIYDLIAYCPQENVLFESNLKENLLLNISPKDDKNNENLIKYLFEELDLNNILLRFKDMNKNINLSNKPFSGGELQRLCIIRTLLRDKPIEIYDEPTHYLDKSTAKKVSDFIIENGKKKLLIISTHEEYIMEKADILINLDEIS